LQACARPETGVEAIAAGDDDVERFEAGEFARQLGRGSAREPCQLYLISPLDVGGDFPDRLAAALEGGSVAAFQFRVKGVERHEAARLAEPLQRLCADRDVAFIVNDSPALAKRIGAGGVHLGQGDGDPREARALLGPAAQIGVTCHDSRHLAMEAGEAGADYVAFGAFFPTSTKEARHHPEPSILSWWSALFEIPCVAIGGITPENGGALVEAGADFLAVCNAVWADPEGPAAAVAAFQEMLKR
jgi:thiamine-phosphate pyrophosphorylase